MYQSEKEDEEQSPFPEPTTPAPNSPTIHPSPPPAPDGGLEAWTQVLCMHFTFFNSWGVNNSFSIFQQLYTSTLAESASNISWIGSVQTSLLFFMGVFAGRATDAGHFRVVYASGVFLQLLGFFMLSLCHSYWQIFLAQGVCMGLGNGLAFSPGLSVMSSYFVRHRAVAVGLAAAGAATGGLVYPVLIERLLYVHDIGFGWTVRAAGLVMLVTQVPGLALYRPRYKQQQQQDKPPLVDWAAFKEKPLVFFTIAMFLNFWGLYFTFFYLGTFARDRIGMSNTLNLILVLNGVGVIGRIVPSLIGDRITGRLNMLIPISVASAVLIFAWMAVDSVAGLYVFTVFYGLVGGAAQSLFPATATTMTPDVRRTGTRLGMILSVVGFATLTGPAIEGALIQQEGGSYVGAQAFAASAIMLGALFAEACRVAKTGLHLRVKV
ncbi:MFS general substrate transporter [Aspergillus steynii IBT 23096]|uniref:MFS general substrate transporter n=1 Tax=Aspergillus steynii IBT 23096 TaxID=1392250 RepID=A0A2I2GRL0_9EURO|nr:MFS general substrate transporter [Aspergillus steynii IBT 23096]PLB55517.1 MFS general substrate transporter [Aspergillus steynii IBT 23096]